MKNDLPIRHPDAPLEPTEEELREWRIPPQFWEPPGTSSGNHPKPLGNKDLAIPSTSPSLSLRERGVQEQGRNNPKKRGNTEQYGITIEELSKNTDLLKEPEKIGMLELRRGSLTVLAAREKTGKTTLASGEAARVSKEGYAVLWISYEESPRLVQNRLKKKDADRVIVLANHEIPRKNMFRDGQAQMREIIESIYPDYIIIDSASSYVGSVLPQIPDHSEGEKWQAIVNNLRAIASDVDAAMLVLAHSPKGEAGVRGSTGIAAAADVVITMDQKKTKRQPKPLLQPYRGLHVLGRFGTEEFVLEYDEANDDYHRVHESGSETTRDTRAEQIEYWLMYDPEMSDNDIYKEVGGRRADTLKLIREEREKLDIRMSSS